LALALLVACVAVPTVARAMCSCFPCVDCEIFNSGQATFIIVERDAAHVSLIPNIRIEGPAERFALVVPTPTVPTLQSVDKIIWQESTALTAPPVNFSDGGSGCGQESSEAAPTSFDDVEIISRTSVGAFIATTIRAGDAVGLVGWLNANGFETTPAEQQILGRYVERDWVFTALKLDPADPESRRPNEGWDTNVNPVAFRYAATSVEVPLDLMGINRSPSFPTLFYVVDDHRAQLDGFQVNYANRLSDREYSAIRNRYPTLATRLHAGAYLTRLDRTFNPGDAMTGSLRLEKSGSDRELFWPNQQGGITIPLEGMIFLLVPAGLLRRRRER
jgi:hypothetical protein